MKHLAVLLAAASGVFAADFTTGQAARLVIGQPTFTSQLPDSTDSVLGGAGGIAYTNGMLVVADTNRLGAAPLNHRVLIFRNLNTPPPTSELSQGARCPACFGKADVILGKLETVEGKPQYTIGLSRSAFRLPTAVASDGVRLAVADTDNNRVLIWLSMPAASGQPADVVLGQPDFESNCPNAVGPRNSDGLCPGDVRVPNQKSLRGPQGVWMQNGKLFVADDQNHRVLIWNQVPTQNFAPADVVLGAPNFYTAIEPDLTKKDINAKADTMLNPVSVTSDGVRMFVSDLGHNRVLIWNQIPGLNGAPADIVIGQPDMTSATANNATKLCPVFGKDADGNDQYPARCAATLNFPRFALSDGTRLFVADGGNDRVLVFNTIPQQNGVRADAVLGQINDLLVQTSDTEDNPDVTRRAAADAVRTPTSLAWDGTNLYVAGPFDRRVLVFTPAPTLLPLTGIRNAASMDVFALGGVTFAGKIKENDEVTIKITHDTYEKKYTYKIKKDDTFDTVLEAFVQLINAGEGDPWVIATANNSLAAVVLTSRLGGAIGNDTGIETTVTPTAAEIVATTTGSSLSGGQDAARLAPGSLVSIFGAGLADLTADQVVSAPAGADPLPTELAGVQVYVDGMKAPLLSVTRDQVNAQLPYEVLDSTSASAYVRTKKQDGTISYSTALGIPLVPANPGVFALAGLDPRPGVVLHGSSYAVGTIYVEGTAKAGDQVIVTINEDRNYGYTLKEGDTLRSARDALIEQINRDDPEVSAFPGGQFSRIRLRARVPGTAGEGIKYKARVEGTGVVSAGTTEKLCCANVEGAVVTDQNPAVPGENIIVYATGLGMLKDDPRFDVATGFTYKGTPMNEPAQRMDAVAGDKTANVLYFGMKPGTVGIYEIHLELLSNLETNPKTQAWVMQDAFVSNIFTFPVVAPPAPETTP